MSKNFEGFFSKYQCGFRKSFIAQPCFVSMFEKWKAALDNMSHFWALLRKLSKAFHCLSHNVLIAKLNTYGFSMPTCGLYKTIYLTFYKEQRSEYRSREEILFGVPQGSILGPLIFNIFLCNLFLIMNKKNCVSYVNVNTLYTADDSNEENGLKCFFSCSEIIKWKHTLISVTFCVVWILRLI